jgi:hypothetical protein
VVAITVCLATQAHSQPPAIDGPKRYTPNVGTKSKILFNAVSINSFDGVVEKIDGTSVTILGRWTDLEKAKSHTFEAVDVLANGGLREGTYGDNAYLWSDIKKGDTVELGVVKDDGDGTWYCVDVGIRRRPGAKLPESQNPKSDERRFRRDTIYNDIDNGLDVDEDDIAVAFPGKVNPWTGQVLKERGLPADYLKKLEANREKIAKEKKELEAKPPEKK